MTTELQQVIELYKEAAKVYEGPDQRKWARTQNNLAAAYANLPTGDRVANLQKGIAGCKAALWVSTEKDFPLDWAATQTNLGVLYELVPGANPENLKNAKACFESALRVYTEDGFPDKHRATAAKLADVDLQLLRSRRQ